MFKRKYYLYLGETEQRVLIKSLVRMKNRLIRERRCTGCVDELLQKICFAPGKIIRYMVFTWLDGTLFQM